MAECFCHFARVLFSRNFAYVKFRENKVLAKISEFTVNEAVGWSAVYVIVAALSY